jgi:dephospho-CoA kinase
LVGSYLAEAGAAVLEADAVARDLMRPGRQVFQSVVDAFGNSILAQDGTIDRACLGRIVFADHDALAMLNGLVHPAVRNEWERWLNDPDTLARAPAGVAAVIVPLLFESGMSDGWDAVVCLASSEARQMERLSERGLDEQSALDRIRAQMPTDMKVDLSDYVIVNDGTEDMLKEQTIRVLARIVEERNGR